jgi:prolyl-tRNA synthetase
MNATFQDGNGADRLFVMGCYGIGVSRTVAAAIEQNHDEHGIIFPLPLAPMQVVILNLDPKSEKISSAAEDLYQALQEDGIEVLLDDRDERPGIKFKDGDLIGIPYRVTIGKHFDQEGEIEIRQRKNGETFSLPAAKAKAELIKMIQAELAETREG